MVELSAEQFAQRAFDLNLIDERQLQEVWEQIGTNQLSGDQCQQLLLRRECLTNYQAKLLLRGETTGFFYGDYKVLYLIGTGTFARVYRASHRTTGEIVAVKVLRRRFSDDPEQADRFYREGKMGATLKHANIVPIMDVYSQKGEHFLVMQFIEGRNLREFIKIRKKFEPVQAARLVADIAAGLGYAFARGICHRDLKMSNVIVSSTGQAMLLDFGLAGGDKQINDDAMQNPSTHHRLCRPGAGHRRAKGRLAQRHLLPGLHLLPHAHRHGADLRNQGSHSASQPQPVCRRGADLEGRSEHPAADCRRGEQGHGPQRR